MNIRKRIVLSVSQIERANFHYLKYDFGNLDSGCCKEKSK